MLNRPIRCPQLPFQIFMALSLKIILLKMEKKKDIRRYFKRMVGILVMMN